MSYDIYLQDPVTHETAEVAGHLMIGGTYKADYHPETGTFTPAINTEAHLNITYNYGPYYREVDEKGIRCIYGLNGLESIPVLENMIAFLEKKYFIDGEWIHTKRMKKVGYDEQGNIITDFYSAIVEKQIEITYKEIEVDRYEGDCNNYWEPTAVNAIRPLYQLKCLAQMRPDCIWDGD